MLVGRGPERARIDALLRAAQAGTSGTLVILGEPGIGKTSLLADARDRADGFRALDAAGVERESVLPYAGLSQLLHPLVDLMPALPAAQRSALAAALGLSDSGTADRFSVYAATLALLTDAAARVPLLACLDDAQWLDAETSEAIGFAVRRMRADRVAVIVAGRTTGAALADYELPQLALGGLDQNDAAELIEQRLGRSAKLEVVAALHAAAAGNPLVLGELIRSLDPAQLAGFVALPDPLPAGADVRRTFGPRVDALGERPSEALLIAATLDSAELQELERALADAGLELADLAPAEKAEIITLSGGRFDWAHPVLRSVAYDRAKAPARRAAHAAVAAALGAERDRARRAWHFGQSTLGADEQLARELEAAAVDARTRGAPGTAARAFEASAAKTPDGETRATRLLEAAREAHVSGSTELAVRLLDEALDVAGDSPLLRADIQRLRAQADGPRRQPNETLRFLTAEAALVEPHDPVRASTMRLDAALVCTMLGRPQEALGLAELSHPAAAAAGGLPALIAAYVLGGAKTLCGHGAAATALLEQARPLVESRELQATGLGLAAGLIWADIWRENFERACDTSRGIVARLRSEASLSALSSALATRGWADYLMGAWDEAEALFDEADALARDLGQPFERLRCAALRSTVAAARGRFDEARSAAGPALELTRAGGISAMEMTLAWSLGFVDLCAEEYDRASAMLERAQRINLDAGMNEPGVVPWGTDLAEAYLRTNRRDDAEKTLAIVDRQVEATGRQLPRAAAARCRGLLASDEDFEQHFERALDDNHQVPCPFELARTELYFGERLRRARRRTQARRWLRRALDTFDGLAAEPWSERARRELRATGERARRRTPEAVDELTPQELQVIALVTRGATNKEVAATLFVSPKTIETHLSRVYRKLGVRSRTELTSRFDTARADRTRAAQHSHSGPATLA